MWLQEVAEGMYAAFQRSNYYDQMHEYFQDGGSIGTATIYSEENIQNEKIVFSARHPKEIYIAENMYGDVDTVHRLYKLSAREAIKKFDKEKLGSDVQDAIKNHPDKKFEFLHTVFPNEDRVYGKLNAQNKKYVSVYLEPKGDKILNIVKEKE